MCKNIVPPPGPVVIVSDVVSGVTMAGLAGPALEASVVVAATNCKSVLSLGIYLFSFNKKT
jgi:hypothetical protein